MELRTAKPSTQLITNPKGTYGLFNYGLAPTGTYIYKISFKKARDDERVEVIGSVNLLR